MFIYYVNYDTPNVSKISFVYKSCFLRNQLTYWSFCRPNFFDACVNNFLVSLYMIFCPLWSPSFTISPIVVKFEYRRCFPAVWTNMRPNNCVWPHGRSKLFDNYSAFQKFLDNLFVCFVCLFVLGFNVSLTLFQSYCDDTCMRQVRVLPHWNAPVAGTWQEHPTQSHYKLTPGRPAIFPSTHLSMPSVSKEDSCTIF